MKTLKSIKRFALSTMGIGYATRLVRLCPSRQSNRTTHRIDLEYYRTPMAEAIKYFATDKGLGFGVAIIIVTIIVRFDYLATWYLPIMEGNASSEKMNALKPCSNHIKHASKRQQLRKKNYKRNKGSGMLRKGHGISVFGGVGCFPILIQMPFFSAIYFSAQYTDGVASSTFLYQSWFPKSAPCRLRWYPLLSQSLLSLHGVEDEMQREQLKKMIYMSPLMIVVFSFFALSQCDPLLGCRWFHDDSPTVHR